MGSSFCMYMQQGLCLVWDGALAWEIVDGVSSSSGREGTPGQDDDVDFTDRLDGGVGSY